MSMTFLQLFQRLHSETGLQGTTPTTVIDQTGMNQRLVNWILTAYEDLQGLHETWFFRQGEFSFSTEADTQNYTPTEAGVSDLASWGTEDIRIYSSESDETELIYYPWIDYRKEFKFGSNRSQSQRPIACTFKPDMSLDLWPIPDAVYTVNGPYRKKIATMTLNTSEPIMPDHHMILVWGALMYYGAHEGAPEEYAHGQNEYKKLLLKLENNQLPKLEFRGTLA